MRAPASIATNPPNKGRMGYESRFRGLGDTKLVFMERGPREGSGGLDAGSRIRRDRYRSTLTNLLSSFVGCCTVGDGVERPEDCGMNPPRLRSVRPLSVAQAEGSDCRVSPRRAAVRLGWRFKGLVRIGLPLGAGPVQHLRNWIRQT
jgi:hypothetical protein